MVVGTGVACSAKDYGTGADCSLGRVEITPDGRISIHSDAVEMGNGIGTALANRVASHIGGIAAQDEAAKNPRWLPEISSATSASIRPHLGAHAAPQAAPIEFRFRLEPTPPT